MSSAIGSEDRVDCVCERQFICMMITVQISLTVATKFPAKVEDDSYRDSAPGSKAVINAAEDLKDFYFFLTVTEGVWFLLDLCIAADCL